MTRERVLPALVLIASVSAQAWAQTPQPFPKPGDGTRAPTTQQQQPPPGVKVLPPQSAPPPAATPPAAGDPSEQTLGLPIYSGAQFIVSYDAGRGQRYYLFGTNGDFLEVVGYYRTALKQRGELVFPQPPIHMFEVGRFREDTMAFPPGVTVKDYTWGGSKGYINPKPGGQPTHFRTIIQIVPVPPIAK